MSDDDHQTMSDEHALNRVPRTANEERLLLSSRPPAWEYLLFASVLLRKAKELEPKWREHKAGTRRRGTTAMATEAAIERLSDELTKAGEIVDEMVSYLDPDEQERAFGAPGEPGNPQLITGLAEGIVDGYEELLDWSAALRAAGVPRELRRLYDLQGELADLPLRQTRVFIRDLVRQFDGIPAAIGEGRPVRIELELTLTVDETVLQQHGRECQNLSKRLGSVKTKQQGRGGGGGSLAALLAGMATGMAVKRGRRLFR